MDSSTSIPGPQLQFLNSTSPATWQQLPPKPGADRTSYYISKDSDSGSNALKLLPGDFEDGNHGNPDLIVGIHIQNSGTIFIESLHYAQAVHLSRETKPKSPRPIKRLLPCSKPPKERMLVLLDSDATIFINNEAIIFELGTALPSLTTDGEGDIAMEEEDEPQVLVQQSHPQELLRRGESDVQSTPAIPETVTEEPRVHETPSVKSRFMNPDSATVTLPRKNIPREDTFKDIIDGDTEATPREGKHTFAKSSKTGPVFGKAQGKLSGVTSKISGVDGANLCTSDEEGEAGSRSLGMDKAINGVKETPKKGNRDVGPVAAMMGAVSGVNSHEETEDEEKENRSSAEAMRKLFSESAMITPFGSAMDEVVREVISPGVEDEEEEGGLPDGANTPKSHIKKHGVPEGFLYEEHKKDVTPKQVYGKNKRRAVPTPKEKRATGKGREVSGETVGSVNDSDDEPIRGAQVNRRGPKRTREIIATDESEEEGVEVFSQRKEVMVPNEEDTVMETADDEDEVVPPPRTQRGRKTVHSLPSTAATTEDDIIEIKRAVRGIRSKRIASTKKTEKAAGEQDKPGFEEREVELTSTAKPTRGTRSKRETKKLSDASENVFSTAPEETPEEVQKASPRTKPSRPKRKRRRSGDIDEEDEHPSQPTTRERTVESTIQLTEQPKSKRAKTTPVKKAPATKRGRKKDVTLSPPESSGELLGDTQYTIQVTQTQTQALDRVEVKTPKTVKKKAAPARKPTARGGKAGSQPLETGGDEEAGDEDGDEETSEKKTRTKSRYEGDAPKIVFSNSGLDGRKDIEKFLRANGGKKMQNVSASGVNFLVVGPGELKRTPKLTVGVALGKYIVEDQWLIDSKETGYFLDPDEYIPYDPTHEKAWSFSLTTAISRGREGLNCILKDHNVYITSSLLSQLKASKQEDSLVEMLKAAGAGTITKRSPKARKEDDEQAEQTLILGTEKGDGDVAALEKAGWTVYGTGIVAISVLRGKLDVGEEFRIIVPGVDMSQKVGRGRKGK